MTFQTGHTSGPSVYLCQVGPKISCGACCGLYNVADPSPEVLGAMLERRTRLFAGVPRTVDGIDAFKARVEKHEPQERPFPDFHHCPFLGMIEDDGRRVGCLLHPEAKGNAGIDWRGLSYYGGMACRTYFCPSVRRLPDRWLDAIRRSMDHWYPHGLIVTERQLLRAFFTEVERRIARPVDAAAFKEGSEAAAHLRHLAALKTDWSFRRRGAPGVGHYFFEDGLYPRPSVWRADESIPASPFEAILRELDSGFESTADLEAAEQRIAALLDRLAAALS
jgi:hypothetical protein